MAERHEAIRTCIGCRRRAPQWELVRYVLAHATERPPRVVPDDGQYLPGRGAWLHDDDGCRQLAVRRRAFRRALRLAGDVEVEVDLGGARQDPDGDGDSRNVASPMRHTEEDGSRE